MIHVRSCFLFACLCVCVGCSSTPNEHQTFDWCALEATQSSQQKTSTPRQTKASHTDIEAIFVSGTLGSYNGCPEKGIDTASAFDARATKQSANCHHENQGLYDCSDAQVTLHLKNVGNTHAQHIRIKEILLLDEGGHVRANLPVLGVVEAATNRNFDGVLEMTQRFNVRVGFTGPRNPGDFDNIEYGAKLLIVIESDTHEPIELETQLLFPESRVVT